MCVRSIVQHLAYDRAPDPRVRGLLHLHVYILRCSDGTLYTGITNDLDKRVKAHSEGHGARYTWTRRPVELVYREAAESRSAATVREAEIKRMSRKRKVEMVAESTVSLE